MTFFYRTLSIYVTEKNCNFDVEDCLALNCTLKYFCISPEKERTLRVKKLFVFINIKQVFLLYQLGSLVKL